MFYLDEQLHQNVNRMVRMKHINQLRYNFLKQYGTGDVLILSFGKQVRYEMID